MVDERATEGESSPTEDAASPPVAPDVPAAPAPGTAPESDAAPAAVEETVPTAPSNEGAAQAAAEPPNELGPAFDGGAPAGDEAPPADPTPAADDRRGADEAPAADDAPGADEAPAEDEAPAADDAPGADEAPAADQPPAADEAPSVDAAPAEPAAPRTVGRFIADTLRTAGVRYAFTVPGESFLGLLEGLQAAGIRVVATRHEGGAAFMAEAHGQLTGRPAVALATRAVGAANLAIGIHTARQDSTPMFVLVGQVERRFRGREAFQEIDQASTIGGLAAQAVELTSVADLPSALGAAVRAATGGRPGPAFLSVPEDLIDEIVPAAMAPDLSRPTPPRPEPSEVRAAIQFLACATRPVILAGAGVLRARTSTELIRFAELLRVPVIASWRRADVIPNDHPLYLGMAGYGSPRVVRERLAAADAVLVLGSRLSEITSFGYSVPAADQPWMHVDVEPLDRPDLAPPVASIRADSRAFLRAAVARLQEGVLDAASADARASANETDRAAWEAATAVDERTWGGPGVHPANIIAIARRVLPDDAIVTTDAG
ncbi:MAG TPA: thiamine pyrophosphate-binding protein, partial [Candidatus Limnocylindrales bacterium]|nr:thiamine pyrophosphate-binding protein [Candidatus Limnocylindrales bacterium]